MINVVSINENILEVEIIGEIKEGDWPDIGRVADDLINTHGSIRIILNGSHFEGWEDVLAAEKHFGFVKNHHKKVEKLAFVIGHAWQSWLATFIGIFLHPEIKFFEKDNKLEKARTWIRE